MFQWRQQRVRREGKIILIPGDILFFYFINKKRKRIGSVFRDNTGDKNFVLEMQSKLSTEAVYFGIMLSDPGFGA